VRALFERMIDQARAGTVPMGASGTWATPDDEGRRVDSGAPSGPSSRLPAGLCGRAGECVRLSWRVATEAVGWIRRGVAVPAGRAD